MGEFILDFYCAWLLLVGTMSYSTACEEGVHLCFEVVCHSQGLRFFFKSIMVDCFDGLRVFANNVIFCLLPQFSSSSGN